MISQALAGDPITIYGDGSQTRSFCYVDDLVDGLIRLMLFDRALPHAVNLGNPNERTIKDTAILIRQLTGSNAPMVFRGLPIDDPLRRKPDITLAWRLLGWKPSNALNDGLRQTITWFRNPTVRTPARTYLNA